MRETAADRVEKNCDALLIFLLHFPSLVGNGDGTTGKPEGTTLTASVQRHNKTSVEHKKKTSKIIGLVFAKVPDFFHACHGPTALRRHLVALAVGHHYG